MSDDDLVAVVARAIRKRLSLLSQSWAEIAARAAVSAINEARSEHAHIPLQPAQRRSVARER